MADETAQPQQSPNPIQAQAFGTVLVRMLIMVFLGEGHSEAAQGAEKSLLQSGLGNHPTLKAHWDYLGVEGPPAHPEIHDLSDRSPTIAH